MATPEVKISCVLKCRNSCVDTGTQGNMGITFGARTRFLGRGGSNGGICKAILDPKEREVKGQIKAERISAYIAEKSVLKSANKHASSVGLMSLVGGGSQWESAQLFKVRRPPLIGINSNQYQVYLR